MVYLVEKGRISAQEFTQLAQFISQPNGLLVELPIDIKIARGLSSVDVQQVPDMPDRIIATTALVYGVPLISRDSKIRASKVTTLW
jgi:PIN domain nuclease of toxin-antitoxin system